MLGNFLGKLMPKAEMTLPLSFQGKNVFHSVPITIISFLIFCLLFIASIQTLLKVGEIQSVI
jgi:hypothetical protein